MKRITFGGLVAGAVVVAGLAAAPAAVAMPNGVLPAEDAGVGCTVSGGSLSWGVKESFRSYISGTIANGSWEVADGASYETPLFGWAGATGSIDPATGVGDVSYTGSIHFTGHDGVLDMTLANPTVHFAEDGSATLLLDTRSTDTSGNPKVDERQGELASAALPAPIEAVTGSVSYADLPVALTEAGAAAFGGFYQAGDALDPLTFSFDLDCVTAEAPEAEVAQDREEVTAAPISTEAEGSVPWVVIGIVAGVVVLAAAALAAVAVSRRKRGAAAVSESSGSAGSSDRAGEGADSGGH